jgi:hypothetical protein
MQVLGTGHSDQALNVLRPLRQGRGQLGKAAGREEEEEGEACWDTDGMASPEAPNYITEDGQMI